MKIADLHADIGWNILEKKKEGIDNPFLVDHLDDLIAGNMELVVSACFFEGKETFDDMKEMVTLCVNEIQRNGYFFVKNKEDLNQEGLKFLLSVEGMCGVDDVNTQLPWLYKQGVRIASLTWNEENRLGCGVSKNIGLSNLGKKAVSLMEEMKMIIDVSHASDETFWDIINNTSKPVIATHSNSRTLCNVARNLTDEQIKAICLRKGLIGLNAVSSFVKSDHPTVFELANHARHIASLGGVDCVAFGFDFLNYVGSKGLEGLSSARYTKNMIDSLYQVGFNSEEIEKIAYNNVINYLNRWM